MNETVLLNLLSLVVTTFTGFFAIVLAAIGLGLSIGRKP